MLEFKSILPSTDKDDAVTFELISKSPAVEIVKPPPAVIPPDPMVKFPATKLSPVTLAYPFPV